MRKSVRGENSYWLPTSTDRFYPDFIAEMHEGRLFVMEYEGAHLAGNEDTAEKANIGARLEAVSEGSVIFWMAERAKQSDFRERMDEALSG